ncbi:MAG: endonuclease MutS2 [Thermodesulfovibrionales bacterium]
MDKTSLDSLEFRKLLELIAGFTHSEASGKAVRAIVPFEEMQDILTRQGLVREIMRMSDEGAPLRMSYFPDISSLIAKARPEGAVLEGIELAGFIPVLEISEGISEQIRESGGLPFLEELVSGLTGFPDLLRLLKRSVDREGNILDSASALLADLRERIRRLEARITKKLEEMVRDEHIAVFLQDNFVTKRSGRWVIPVRMDSKGQVAGVVHDVSKSGETAFMEPLAVIQITNELENLVAEQKAEEIRILRSISSKVRESAEGISAEYSVVVHLDLLNAISVLADKLRMELPRVLASGGITLRGARHPLLLLALRKTAGPREVVPLDVGLGGDTTVMVITGSNAGGKTIAIKTIGLLVVMALSGMPVPASSSSAFPLVHRLLVDIGDEQSIENSLSTFSAHVANISKILKTADPLSLVLIDELGTGTDPDEGGALACAVLKELRESRALVFATTHLSDIKGYVHRTGGMLNASMEFDPKSLSPTYRLRIGEPGQSHALETAKRYGLPESIIASAKAMLGGVKVEFDALIADLTRKRTDYETGIAELERQKADLAEEKRLTEQRLSEAEALRKESIEKAYTEASEIVYGVKRQMHALMEEMKKGEKAKSRGILREVGERQKQISQKLREYDTADRGSPAIDDIKEGDTVFVRSLGYDASVLKIISRYQRIRVAAGDKEIEIPMTDVGLRRGKPIGKDALQVMTDSGDESVSTKITLIGMRVEEALSKLEPFLNHASLAGLSEVTVIHGLGTGALSRAVREHLEGHPLVKKFRKGEQSEGGNGVTVVTMT